jgi:hypothetical protein
MALDDETQASADASRWAGRGVYVPKGMTREKITRIADALIALDGGVTAPPRDHSEACFLATVVLEALRPRRGQT